MMRYIIYRCLMCISVCVCVYIHVCVCVCVLLYVPIAVDSAAARHLHVYHATYQHTLPSHTVCGEMEEATCGGGVV